MNEKEILMSISGWHEYGSNLDREDISWLIRQAERAINNTEELDRWLSGKNIAVSTHKQISEKSNEILTLKETLTKVKEDLMPLRGDTKNDDNYITELCININRVLEGKSYDE